jgi:hypothetical protein
MSPKRSRCEYCVTALAKRGRRFCSKCYRAGVAAATSVLRIVKRRPPASGLADTGMRINDQANTLIHPDGRVETPVPGYVVFRFWIASPTHKSNLLRVLRTKGASHVHA